MRRKIKIQQKFQTNKFKNWSIVGVCHEPQASGVIDPSEYSHYPRIEYYTFSTTTVKRN
jgi:hypothetical protein